MSSPSSINPKSSDGWCTPKSLAELLGPFDLDPCSNPRSHILSRTSLMLENGENGLQTSWWGSVFVNGPYSNPLPWCNRLEAYTGPWCALWKLDPTTLWWSRLIRNGAYWAPFRSRIKFERPDKPSLTANFPSVLVYRVWEPSQELLKLLWNPRQG
jgi:DNA N-6-adenine-methyltransferase (Dam)